MKNKVADYMSDSVITVKEDQTIEEIARLMKETSHDGFPVIEGKKIVGMVTIGDLVFKKGKQRVKEIMSEDVAVTYPETDLTDAARIMFRKGISRLPVIDKDKKLVGIITNADVLRSHIERVTPDKVKKLVESLERIYSVKTIVRTGIVEISRLIPTQNKIDPDEFRGREYELKRGLAEPVVVVKSGERLILADGHHRALAAYRIGFKEVDAYIITLSRDIELGLEKTAKSMGLKTVGDIGFVEDSYKG